MSTTPNATPDSRELQQAAFFAELAERSKTDPLIGAKMGSKEVSQILKSALKNERGIHIESYIAVLGALAGYACQASVRAQAQAQGLPETALMNVAQTTDGKSWYLGEALNKALVNSQYSVWGIAAAGAEDAGCAALPDVVEMFKYASSVLGTEAFGQYRSTENKPADLPQTFLTFLWTGIFKTVVQFCPNPEHWPVLLAIALRDAIIWGKDVIDPCLGVKLGMDTAVQMSMVQLEAK